MGSVRIEHQVKASRGISIKHGTAKEQCRWKKVGLDKWLPFIIQRSLSITRSEMNEILRGANILSKADNSRLTTHTQAESKHSNGTRILVYCTRTNG